MEVPYYLRLKEKSLHLRHDGIVSYGLKSQQSPFAPASLPNSQNTIHPPAFSAKQKHKTKNISLSFQ